MTRQYMPSNGTEGMCFIDSWCFSCANDSEEKPCPILTDSMIGDPPKEWIYGDHGPKCTAFTTERDNHTPRAMKMREQAGQLRLF